MAAMIGIACGALLAQTIDATPHDWLDHLWGWAKVGGALLALVALGIAWIGLIQSRDASTWATASAAAAQENAAVSKELAEIAREELEMVKAEASRRAVIEIRSITGHPVPGSRSTILQLGLLNSGNASTEAAGSTCSFRLAP